MAPLNLEHVFNHGISLIEWPSRLRRKPSTRLDVTLTHPKRQSDTRHDSQERFMKLVPHGHRWMERLEFLMAEGVFDDLLVD